MRPTFSFFVSLALFTFCSQLPGASQEVLIADGNAWPGRILSQNRSSTSVFWERSVPGSDRWVPKVQSLAQTPDGRIIFCSGLDRSVWELYAGRERELHFGGGLVRQVRVDTNGDIFWSGLETPIDNNPLPDGFLYRMRHGTNNVETLLTFSQDLVGRDWWGAFDVRQGEVFVATRSLPTRIYRLVNSIPELVVTLPTELASFRIIDGQQFLVSNGNDRLLRFRDIASPQTSELVVQTPGRFVDFTVRQ